MAAHFSGTMGSFPITTPFGRVYYINADCTASGSPYKPIESFMKEKVIKYYANAHSNAHNGQLMSSYMNQAKDAVRRSVNAKPCDRVIFTGNGCSGAIIHIIHLLDLKTLSSPKTVVFVSVAEHHSNYLPWTHLPVELVIVPMTNMGLLDTDYLESALKQHSRSAKICSFIAGSNVTGIIQPVHEVSELVHRYNGLIFWDYAGCAPYVAIDMHKGPASYFDAIFISPHKFLGGPGSPGVLVANHRMFKNEVPFCPGGGTVRFVSADIKRYSDNLEQRETGGTPNILGCIKAGLAFQLKDELIHVIAQREEAINHMVRPRLFGNQRLTLINPKPYPGIHQVPIYSFKIQGLHYNFIVALLNDIFGIQSRGGVSCCSMFAHFLLRNCKRKQMSIYKQIVSDHGVPADYGWCRVTFHYSMSDAVIEYILYAIDYVAQYGQLFLDQYDYIETDNHWVYRGYQPQFPTLSYHNKSKVKETILTSEVLNEQLKLSIRLLKARGV
jgi:selenocysteine lyase/cysteine desulfurase